MPNAVEAMKLGAFDYIQKPFNGQEIEIIIERALRERNLVRDNEIMRRTIEDLDRHRELIGQSAAMRPVLEKVQRVAQSSATVLITGESGTGKELIARAIHAASPRASQPMLCVNCAALSPTLLESELFGHEKGAFTGRGPDAQGAFRAGRRRARCCWTRSPRSPRRSRPSCCACLQEREFERVGSSVTRRVDVRVIATTNRDLREWAAKARFREDLYYRLSVLPIEVPPLRERREDIPLLMDYFMGDIAAREGRERPTFSPEALADAPGIRLAGQRAGAREPVRAGLRARGRPRGRAGGDRARSSAVRSRPPVRPRKGLQYRDGQILNDAERDLILRTLERFSGHREKTARALGIGLRTLGLKLKKWREEGSFHEERRRHAAALV